MKKIGLLVAATLAATFVVGCDTPHYSATERWQQYSRNIDLEWKMAQDEIDRALLLRPLTKQSGYNVR